MLSYKTVGGRGVFLLLVNFFSKSFLRCFSLVFGNKLQFCMDF